MAAFNLASKMAAKLSFQSFLSSLFLTSYFTFLSPRVSRKKKSRRGEPVLLR